MYPVNKFAKYLLKLLTVYYKLNFVDEAKEISPIKLGQAKNSALQSSRYTRYDKLMKANDVTDLFD